MTTTGIHHRLVLARAPAKLNLFLEVKDKRPDGYHEIESVIVAVSLQDTIAFQVHDAPPRKLDVVRSAPLRAAGSQIPNGQGNLIWSALDRWGQFRGTQGSADRASVTLFKRIPEQAGLGGGSSDAAAALRWVRDVDAPDVSNETLSGLAAHIGSDVPFFIRSGISLCRGRGEIIEALQRSKPLWFVVAKPPTGASTPEVYRRLPANRQPISSRAMVEAIKHGTPQDVGKLMFNRLQSAAESLVPEIRRAAAEFERLRCCGHQLSGSGSAYFGLFVNRPDAHRAQQVLRARLPTWFVCSCRSLARVSSIDHTSTPPQEAGRDHH